MTPDTRDAPSPVVANYHPVRNSKPSWPPIRHPSSDESAQHTPQSMTTIGLCPWMIVYMREDQTYDRRQQRGWRSRSACTDEL